MALMIQPSGVVDTDVNMAGGTGTPIINGRVIDSITKFLDFLAYLEL
jgi:hypothetical protein